MFPNHKEFDEFKSPQITLWRMTRAEIEHENTLVHYRTTWLLTSQGVLYAVFGFILNAWIRNDLRQDAHLAPLALALTAGYAAYLCLCFHDALTNAERQLQRLENHYRKTLNTLPPSLVPVPPLQLREGPAPLKFGRADSIAAASCVVWVVLLAYSAYSAFRLSIQDGLIVAGIFSVTALLIVVAWMSQRAALKARNAITNTEDNDVQSAVLSISVTPYSGDDRP
jgi:hypothetical protein